MLARRYVITFLFLAAACNGTVEGPSVVASGNTAGVASAAPVVPSLDKDAPPPELPVDKAAAHGPDVVTFRFAPPRGTTFGIRTVRTKTKVSAAGIAASTEVIRTSERVVSTASATGLEWHITPVKFSHERSDGPPNKIDELVASFPFSLFITNTGQVTKVDGYNDVPARMKTMLSASEAAVAAPVLTPETLRRARLAEWSARIGDLAGQTIRVGDVMIGGSDVGAGQLSLHVYSVLVVGPWVACAFGNCIEVTQTFDSDPQSLAAKVQVSKDKLLAAAARATAQSGSATARIYGTSHRTVDPATMLAVAETTVRSIKLEAGTVTDEVAVEYSYETTTQP